MEETNVNTSMEMGSALDLLPVIAALLEIELPNDRVYDGYDRIMIPHCFTI